MAQTDNVTVLRIQLDEGKTQEQLQKLVLDLEATKKAQQALTAERKAGTVTDEQFSQRTVALQQQLKSQQGEYASLTKNLELYRKAQNGEASSYQATQAALSLAIRQQQQLAGSAGDTTEASQALTAQIAAYREELAATDAKQGAFFRQIGNYPKGSEGLTELVQQLVTLQEQQKKAVTGSKEAEEATRRIGYVQQAAAQAGAKEGKTFEETTNFIQGYGEAIRPATAALVQLEQEQQAVTESGQATGEAARQIGFRMGQARKAIDDTTKSLKAEATQAKASTGTTKGLASTFLEAADSSGLLGGAIEVVKVVQEKYTQAQELATEATEASTGALGGLKAAVLATGIGALVVLLGSLASFLGRAQAGSTRLGRELGGLSAVADAVKVGFAGLGEQVAKSLEHPQQAGKDLAGLLGENLLNRVTSLKTAAIGLFTLDGRRLVDAGLQFALGVKDGSDKLQQAGETYNKVAEAGRRLAADQAALTRAENDNITTNKTLLNLIERQKNLRDNEFLSIGQRKAANEEAYRLELQREAQLVKIAQQRVTVLNQQLTNNGGRKLNEDLFKQLKEAENELADIREDAAGKQNELITNRYQLEQERLDKDLEAKAQAFVLYTSQLDQQLAQVQKNSNEELSLLQQKLGLERDAELNVKNLTLTQKLKADTDYEAKSLALSLDFNRRRMLAALQAQADTTASELAGQQAGSDEALRLQVQQIEEQRRLAIASLADNADNTAAIEKINAQAANQRRQAEYADATRLLQDYLDTKRRAVENDYADGLIQEGEYQRRLAAIAKAGTDAQAVINQDYNQSNAANQKQADEQETAARARHTAEVKRQEEVKQEIREATVQAAINYTDTIIGLFGEESAAGQAALAAKKVFALAEIAINLQKQLSANAVTAAQISSFIPPPAGPILGTAYKIAADALSITAAAAQAAEILKLQLGGIAHGPSHDQGGIALYHRGRPAGIEIEGGEPVLTRKVSENPHLLAAASAINVAAGGRALVPGGMRLALGAITQPVAQARLRELAGQPIDYDRLAAALGQVNIYTKTQDTAAALERRIYTQQVSNS